MIVSDEHRFILVHIPKCAGVSVKKALRPIDDSRGDFSRIGDHETLGKIHFAHIPLRDLQAYFPDVYGKLAAYRSVALVRDPVDRFISALFQRLREFKNFHQSQITANAVESEAREIIDYLRSTPGRLDLEHVHFNRQSDYIFNDDVQVVSQIFRLDQLALAADFIEACTGIRIEEDNRLNRSAELRFGALKPLLRMLRAPYAALVPLAARQQIRSGLMRAGIYGDVEKQQFVHKGGNLDRFLREHYADDFRLHAQARRTHPETAVKPLDVQCPI